MTRATQQRSNAAELFFEQHATTQLLLLPRSSAPTQQRCYEAQRCGAVHCSLSASTFATLESLFNLAALPAPPRWQRCRAHLLDPALQRSSAPDSAAALQRCSVPALQRSSAPALQRSSAPASVAALQRSSFSSSAAALQRPRAERCWLQRSSVPDSAPALQLTPYAPTPHQTKGGAPD